MRAGITGHQELGSEQDVAWIHDSLENQIVKFRATYGLTCLAVGADQLFARILVRKKIPYTVIVASGELEKTFNTFSDRASYEELLASANEVVRLDFEAPSERAFLEAGKEVVERSEMVFAVWNGKPARGLGGTGDIVNYAVQRNQKVIHINTITREVIELR